MENLIQSQVDIRLEWWDIQMLVKVLSSMYFVDRRKWESQHSQEKQNIFRLYSSVLKSVFAIALGLFSLLLLKIRQKWFAVECCLLINSEIIDLLLTWLYKEFPSMWLSTHIESNSRTDIMRHNFCKFGQGLKGSWLDEEFLMRRKLQRSYLKTFAQENCCLIVSGQIMKQKSTDMLIRQV